MDGLEYYDQINLLKGGMIFSDAITTVSPRYGQEIQTAEFGCGLEGVLRQHSAKLRGILNGVDYRDWSPEADKLLPANFSPADLKGKAANKAALMEAFGLDKKMAKAPILAMISRLADQKGFDLVAQVLPQLMTQELLVVILGTGDERYHRWLAAEAPKYKGKLGVLVAFDNKLAHLIEAGADMFPHAVALRALRPQPDLLHEIRHHPRCPETAAWRIPSPRWAAPLNRAPASFSATKPRSLFEGHL